MNPYVYLQNCLISELTYVTWTSYVNAHKYWQVKCIYIAIIPSLFYLSWIFVKHEHVQHFHMQISVT